MTLSELKIEAVLALEDLKALFTESGQLCGLLILRCPGRPEMTVIVTDDPDPREAVETALSL